MERRIHYQNTQKRKVRGRFDSKENLHTGFFNSRKEKKYGSATDGHYPGSSHSDYQPGALGNGSGKTQPE